MRRLLVLMTVVLGSVAFADSRGEGFFYVEESFRLPLDTSLPGTSTTDVDLVDLDRDGDLDLFQAEGTDSLEGRPNQLLINNGHGFFTDESATRLPPNNANSTKADYGDVDRDGDLDIIIANVGPEQLLLNNGHGFFTDASAFLPPPAGIFANISADARFADVDRDRDLDILVSNEVPFPGPPGAQNFLWLNDGTGHFVDATANLPPAIDQTAAMLPGDIDRDGDLDVIVLNRGQERVLINDGTGHFIEKTASKFPVTTDSTRGGALADLDRDGDLDLVTGNSRNEPVAIYFNNGHGRFTAGNFGMIPFADETDAGLEVVDLEGDGDLDVYLPNAGLFTAGHGFNGGPDRYFRNNGRGKFQERTAKHFRPPDDPTTDAAFGDIDGDRDLDLVVGNSGVNGGERVFVRHHNGHGHGHRHE